MKRILFFLLMISIIIALDQKSWTAPNPNHIDIGVSIGFFHSSLSPHGEWIEMESGFRVWRPINIQNHWRPYLLGRWIWTDYGWYWMSNEPFGWITYHYGRWYNDDYYGWIWVPDDVWGPAWVEWRYDNSYIGWAPLPPYATFSVSFGISFTTHWTTPVHYWNFIPYHHFGNVIHYKDIASVGQTRRLIRTTRTGLQYKVSNGRIINRGVDIAIIERRGKKRISRVQVQVMHKQSGERIIRSNGNRVIERIEVYRPTKDEMQRGIVSINARRGDRALSIDMKKVERPRIESRKNSNERSNRESVRSDARQTERNVQRKVQQQDKRLNRKVKSEEQTRKSTPRVQGGKLQQNRKEMRRELIQRYERKQNPTPRTTRETLQKRIERTRQSSPSAKTDRSSREKRPSLNDDKRED